MIFSRKTGLREKSNAYSNTQRNRVVHALSLKLFLYPYTLTLQLLSLNAAGFVCLSVWAGVYECVTYLCSLCFLV